MKVANSNIFPLPKNEHMLHLGTIQDSLREYIVMLCIKGPQKGKTYIEEVVLNSVSWTDDVFANLKFIQDDNLAQDLANFAAEQGLTDMKRVINTLVDTNKSHLII